MGPVGTVSGFDFIVSCGILFLPFYPRLSQMTHPNDLQHVCFHQSNYRNLFYMTAFYKQ